MVDVTFADGHRERMLLSRARELQLVHLDRSGRISCAAALGVRGAQLCEVGVDTPMATLALSPADEKAPLQKASEQLGEIASAAFLARSTLAIAQAHGMPSWQTIYFAANGINHFTGRAFLPGWLQKGPVKDVLEFAVIGDMLVGSLPAVASATRALRGTLASLQAARGAAGSSAPARVGDLAAALLTRTSEAAAGGAAALTAGHAAPAPNVPALKPLFKLMKPLYYIGMTASSVAGLLTLPEYLKKHGASGMMSTTSGRDAVIGALSSTATLASMYMRPSPLRSYLDLAGSVLWLAQAINGRGWLDPVLGGDPPQETAQAPQAISAVANRAAVPTFSVDAIMPARRPAGHARRPRRSPIHR